MTPRRIPVSCIPTVLGLVVLACGGEVEGERVYLGVPDFSNAPCHIDGSCKEEMLPAGGQSGVINIDGAPEDVYAHSPWNAPVAVGPAFEKISGMRTVISSGGAVSGVIWVGWENDKPEQWLAARRDGQWSQARRLGAVDPLDAHDFTVALLPNLDLTGRRVVRGGLTEASIEPFHWAWLGQSYVDDWWAPSDGEPRTYSVELLSGGGPQLLELRGEKYMGEVVWRARYFDGEAWQNELDVLPESGMSSIAGDLDAQGRAHLVWQNSETNNLFVRRWDPAGTATTEAYWLAPSAEWFTMSSSDEGAAVVVWLADQWLGLARPAVEGGWQRQYLSEVEADYIAADWCPNEESVIVRQGKRLTYLQRQNRNSQPLPVLKAGPPALGCTDENLVIAASIAEGVLNIFETRPGDILEGTDPTLTYPAHEDQESAPALAVDDSGHAVLAWPGDTTEGVRLFVANRQPESQASPD